MATQSIASRTESDYLHPEYPTILEKSKPGRSCVKPTDEGLFAPAEVEGCLRQEPAELPEVSEIEHVRHYIGLSNRNFGVDSGFYPLGSCTMKYNPKINDVTSSFPGFTDLHPYQDAEECQGALLLMQSLEKWFSDVFGMDAFTIQPAAGAHGEHQFTLVDS